jgi:hypothetical protein
MTPEQEKEVLASGGWLPAQITSESGAVNVLATAERQVKWNRYAAFTAAGAAICQGLGLFLAAL